MFGDMMGKMKEAQQQMGELKKRLDGITVKGDAQGVAVYMTANKEVKDMKIDQSLIDAVDQEQIQDLVLMATNRALKSAENVAESEGASLMKGILPNIPGL